MICFVHSRSCRGAVCISDVCIKQIQHFILSDGAADKLLKDGKQQSRWRPMQHRLQLIAGCKLPQQEHWWILSVNNEEGNSQLTVQYPGCRNYVLQWHDLDCISTASAFSAPVHISVLPYHLKSEKRRRWSRGLVLQSHLSKTHQTTLPNFQICPCQHFMLIHLISERSHIPTMKERRAGWNLFLSLHFAAVVRLWLFGNLGSRYYLASWYLD